MNGKAFDAAEVRSALEMADPNVLRLVLHQLTGDPALATMRVEKTLIWSGALFTYSLGAEHHAEVRERAFAYLQTLASGAAVPPLPARSAIRATMELFGHGPLDDRAFEFAFEEAAFDEFPRDVRWNNRPSDAVLAATHVVVIGAGISGIAAAVLLERLGIPYTVIERQADVGGTWLLNDYPEVRVDSTSMIYQYSFEKRYPWTEFFAGGAETRRYLRHCVEKFRVAQRIVFGTEVVGAQWDENQARWNLVLRDAAGNERPLAAQFVISASGLFSTPQLPDIPGIDGFAGTVLHTAAWQAQPELENTRVALIGTGASGAQIMPWLARNARSLAVFQRTANWIFPMEGYKAEVPAGMQWLFEHVPYYWNWYSYGMYYLNSQLEGLQAADPAWQREGGKVNQRNDELRRTAETHIHTVFAQRPDLIAKALPKYPPMARRPTVDNGWYDALLQDNVTLVTEGIERIEPNGIVDKQGQLHHCELIVCAAGFRTLGYFWPVRYIGRDGATTEALWQQDGPRAYIGMTLPGFPNFFASFGPNSQGRSGSFHSVAEMWARYALSAITHVLENGKRAIECRRDAYDAYNARMDEKSHTLLWESHGHGFYYVTAAGRNVVNSPWEGPEYAALLKQPDFDAFTIR